MVIKGAIDGTVYYADPAGDTLPDASGKQVAAAKGDWLIKSASASVSVKNLDVTGKATIGKVGGTLYASGGGTVDYTPRHDQPQGHGLVRLDLGPVADGKLHRHGHERRDRRERVGHARRQEDRVPRATPPSPTRTTE